MIKMTCDFCKEPIDMDEDIYYTMAEHNSRQRINEGLGWGKPYRRVMCLKCWNRRELPLHFHV